MVCKISAAQLEPITTWMIYSPQEWWQVKPITCKIWTEWNRESKSAEVFNLFILVGAHYPNNKGIGNLISEQGMEETQIL